MPTYISLVVEFLALNPNPTDKQMHALADSIGVDKEPLEAEIYAILAQLLRERGTIKTEQVETVSEEVTNIPTLELPEGL